MGPFLEPNTIFGRVQANEGFIETLLTLDPFDEYVFFLDRPKSSPNLFADHSWPAITRGAIRIEPTQAIPTEIADKDYYCFHFPDPLTDQTRLAVMRNRLSQEIFPITSVPHTLSYTCFSHEFLFEIWPGVSPRDVICATSKAAIDVISAYFAALRKRYALPKTWGQPGLKRIPLGVDTKRFHIPTPQEKEDARKHFALTPDELVCLAHGRISVDDKMDLLPLLYAIARAQKDSEQRIHLIVSGKIRENDNYPKVLEKSAQSLKIPLSLKVTPSNEELSLLYKAADVFVSPSDNLQETFGLTVLEAGASGLPVIASDWDGYRDLLVSGETGYLIPTMGPDKTPYLNALVPIIPDNIHQLLRAQQTALDVPALAAALTRLSNENLRRAMGEKARDHVMRHFSWEQSISRWLALLNELWSIPIDAKKHAELKAAEHPAYLDYAEIFRTYPSQTFSRDLLIVQSRRGKNVLLQKEPAVLWPNLDICLKSLDIRKFLTLARRPICAGALIERLGCSKETGQFAVLWALKHDLLEICAEKK